MQMAWIVAAVDQVTISISVIYQAVVVILLGGAIRTILWMWGRQKEQDVTLKDLERRIVGLETSQGLLQDANDKLDDLLRKKGSS